MHVPNGTGGSGGSISIHLLAEQMKSDRIPINNRFSYFSASPLSEDEMKDYLEEPITALPPVLQSLLPPVFILLVPYIAKVNGSEGGEARFEELPASRALPSVLYQREDMVALALAIKAQDLSDYHYTFYRALADVAVGRTAEDVMEQFRVLLRHELSNDVNGEVDEESWQVKQALLRKKSPARRDTKLFRAYAEQAFIDTLTLYLHGICCDIDVETGPRQLRSRYLRKRLQLLEEIFPPPAGYAVFPEELRALQRE